MKSLLKIISSCIIILLTICIFSCREYINVNPQAPGTGLNLLFQYDSISLNKSSPGSYFDQTYYSNNYNFMDTIRVDFTGATNIDSNNSCNLTVQLVDEDNGGNTVITYTILNPDSVNNSYQLGFNVSGIRSFTVYFNVTMVINQVQNNNFFTKMKNIKVWEVY